jgi:hypothetical protein
VQLCADLESLLLDGRPAAAREKVLPLPGPQAGDAGAASASLLALATGAGGDDTRGKVLQVSDVFGECAPLPLSSSWGGAARSCEGLCLVGVGHPTLLWSPNLPHDGAA